jgi:hypothetical protein
VESLVGKLNADWALAPTELRITQLLQSPTLGGLAVQIAQHQPSARPVETTSAGARFCRRLDEDPHPVRLGRRMLDDALAAWNAEHWLDDARIVTSELVTNSGKHGAPPIFLALSIEPDPESARPALMITVTDASTDMPVEREPGDDGGFGMTVLGGLAKVTTHIHPGGKTIRAVIPKP